jgi:hypothetical protein
MAEDTQIIYGFQTLLKGYAPSTFNMVYEDKKDLIAFITTKDAIIKGSTFEMHGENKNHFNEVSDEIKFEKRTLHIFDMKLYKTKYV